MQLEYEMREQASRAASSSREGSVTGGSSISGDYTDEELSLMQYAQVADGWDAARPGSGQGTGLEAARFLRYSCGELDPEYDGSEPSSGSSPRTPPLSQMTSKQRAAYEAAVSGNFYTRTFALGPKTFLKETTPMSVMSKFCSEHGIVNLFDLGQTADTQRWGLYNLLKLARWPEDVEELIESPPPPGILSRLLMKKKLAKARSGMGSHGHQPNTSWLQVDLPPQVVPTPPKPSKRPHKSPRTTRAARLAQEAAAAAAAEAASRAAAALAPSAAKPKRTRARRPTAEEEEEGAKVLAAALGSGEAVEKLMAEVAAKVGDGGEGGPSQEGEDGASPSGRRLSEGSFKRREAAKQAMSTMEGSSSGDPRPPNVHTPEDGKAGSMPSSQEGTPRQGGTPATSGPNTPRMGPTEGSGVPTPIPTAPLSRAGTEKLTAEEKAAMTPEEREQRRRDRKKSKELEARRMAEEKAAEKEAKAKAKEQKEAEEVIRAGPYLYEELSLLAAAGNISAKDHPLPEGVTDWVNIFTHISELSEEGILLVDMREKGLPIMYANPAVCTMTGYAKEEMVGRNCKLLQGRKTSSAAIRCMTKAIANRSYAILNTLNFKKDGSNFVNNLSLHPITGDTGDYRYNIGILADTGSERGKSAEGKAAVAKFREAMPSRMSTDVNERGKKKVRKSKEEIAAEEEAANGGNAVFKSQTLWRNTLVKLARLVYSLDWNDTLTHLLTLEIARKSFHKWLIKHSTENVVMFEVAYAVNVRLAACTNEKQMKRLALDLGQKYLLEECPPDGEKAIELLKEKAEIAASELAERCLPKFVQSKGCLPLIEQLVGADGDLNAPVPQIPDGLLHEPGDAYSPEVMRWLHGVISLGLALPPMLTITDMKAPGNPLIFVNESFCKLTGYSRDAALGRNCRFLQGPDTEAQSVAVIQAALTDITDCVVKITNYRKTGEAFDMLLALRPVVDAEGTRRFCIGLHFELTPAKPLKTLVTKLGKLIKLFPKEAAL